MPPASAPVKVPLPVTGEGLFSRGAGLLWAGLGNAIDGVMQPLQKHIGAHRMAYLFLAPNLIVFGLFCFWPMLLNLYIAFTGGTSALIMERPFVGFENFRELLDCQSYLEPKTCPVAGYSFWTSLWNTLFFAALQVPLMILVALLTALVLNREIKARGVWRAIFFYPVMLSPVVIAIIWDWVLKRRGILNALLDDASTGWNRFIASPALVPLAGVLALAFAMLALREMRGRAWVGAGIAASMAALLGALAVNPALFALPAYRPVNWLIDNRSGWPMVWAIFVYSWGHLGFYMLILLAGLQAIPRDLYDAAAMDGTPPFRRFFRITLPLLMPTMVVVLVLSLIKAFQVFDEVYVLTGGGPGQATKMMIQHIYETAFTGDSQRYGVAAASSVLVAVLLLALSLLQLIATRNKAGA